VYKAKCKATGRNVAIKYIDFEVAADQQEFFVSLSREIKISIFLSQLKENIFTTKLIDIFFAADAQFD